MTPTHDEDFETVWACPCVSDAKVLIQSEWFKTSVRGVLIPQPSGDTETYVASHRSFKMIAIPFTEAVALGITSELEAEEEPEELATEDDDGDEDEGEVLPETMDEDTVATMDWPALRHLAASLGLPTAGVKRAAMEDSVLEFYNNKEAE